MTFFKQLFFNRSNSFRWRIKLFSASLLLLLLLACSNDTASAPSTGSGNGDNNGNGNGTEPQLISLITNRIELPANYYQQQGTADADGNRDLPVVFNIADLVLTSGAGATVTYTTTNTNFIAVDASGNVTANTNTANADNIPSEGDTATITVDLSGVATQSTNLTVEFVSSAQADRAVLIGERLFMENGACKLKVSRLFTWRSRSLAFGIWEVLRNETSSTELASFVVSSSREFRPTISSNTSYGMVDFQPLTGVYDSRYSNPAVTSLTFTIPEPGTELISNSGSVTNTTAATDTYRLNFESADIDFRHVYSYRHCERVES